MYKKTGTCIYKHHISNMHTVVTYKPADYCTPCCLCLSSSHHALNSLLSALDGYPTATEDPAEIEETARTGTVGGGTGSGRERRDWVPLTGDPLFPSGRLYFTSALPRTHSGALPQWTFATTRTCYQVLQPFTEQLNATYNRTVLHFLMSNCTFRLPLFGC